MPDRKRTAEDVVRDPRVYPKPGDKLRVHIAAVFFDVEIRQIKEGKRVLYWIVTDGWMRRHKAWAGFKSWRKWASGAEVVRIAE